MRKTIMTMIAALAVPAAANAADVAPVEENSVAVPTADLDLSTQEGTEALESRITSAAKNVCERPFIRDLQAMQAWEKCVAEARDEAMAKVAFANPFEGRALASLF